MPSKNMLQRLNQLNLRQSIPNSVQTLLEQLRVGGVQNKTLMSDPLMFKSIEEQTCL